MDDTPTVLFIDDEPALADGYAAILDEYDTHVAYGGRAGLERLDETIDVLCLDRRMPGMSGEEVLAAVREEGYDCHVVLLTGVEPDEEVLELGFDDYLVKPIDKDALRETVDRLTDTTDDPLDTPVLDALGDPETRRCCAALVDGPLSAGELAEATDLSLSTVYRRLNSLQQAGLVESRTAARPDGNHYQTFVTVGTRIEVEVGEELQLRVSPLDRSAA